MGEQVIRQPDGRLAVFCSSTDTIIVYDATREELHDWWLQREVERADREINRVLDMMDAGRERDLYFQFTKSWADALAIDAEHGGEASRDPELQQ